MFIYAIRGRRCSVLSEITACIEENGLNRAPLHDADKKNLN